MIRIITDSTSDIPREVAKELNIDVASLKVNFGSEMFVDQVTITNEQFYEKLAESDSLPTTTLVNPQEFMDIYNKYPNDEIIGIFLSSKLSGTYQSAVLAKEESQRDNIYLIDSGTVTAGLALLIKAACQFRDEKMKAKDIVDRIIKLREKVFIYAVIDTLKYLVKGGRISSTSAFVGGMLAIKPIVKVEDGLIVNIDKARGMKASIAKVIEMYKNDADFNLPHVGIYSANKENFNTLRDDLNEPNLQTYSVGSVVGTHAGPGAVGIAFFRK